MGRSGIRYKIKYQAEQIDRYFDRIFDSAQLLTELSEGRSDYINEAMPIFVAGMEELRKLWTSVRKEL